MEIKHFKKLTTALVLTLVAFLGCAPTVKTTMDSYLKNQKYYQGKNIIFTTELDDLFERFELYKHNEVELTAPLTYFGKRKFWTWYLFLEKDGNKIRCYEARYRVYPGHDAVNLLLQARYDGGEVTVRGWLYHDGIELNRLMYKNSVVRTNYRPPRIGPYFQRY
jgi:hypothetical protein